MTIKNVAMNLLLTRISIMKKLVSKYKMNDRSVLKLIAIDEFAIMKDHVYQIF